MRPHLPILAYQGTQIQNGEEGKEEGRCWRQRNSLSFRVTVSDCSGYEQPTSAQACQFPCCLNLGISSKINVNNEKSLSLGSRRLSQMILIALTVLISEASGAAANVLENKILYFHVCPKAISFSREINFLVSARSISYFRASMSVPAWSRIQLNKIILFQRNNTVWSVITLTTPGRGLVFTCGLVIIQMIRQL